MPFQSIRRGLARGAALWLLGATAAAQANALWVAESEGLLKIDPADAAVALEIHEPAGVDAVAADPDGDRIWAVTGHRLKAYSAGGELIAHTRLPRRHGRRQPLELAAGIGGVWLAAGRHLYYFDAGGRLQERVRFRRPVRALTLDTRENRPWVAAGGTVFVLDAGGEEIDRFRLRFPRVTQLDYDPALDGVWIASGPYLLRLNAADRAVDYRARPGLGFYFRDRLSADGRGGAWGAARGRVSHLNATGDIDARFKPFRRGWWAWWRGDTLRDLAADRGDGSVWLAGRRTLKHHAPDGALLDTFRSDLEDGHHRKFHRLAVAGLAPPELAIDAPAPGAFIDTATPTLALRYSGGAEIDTGSLDIRRDGAPVAADCTAGPDAAHCTLTAPLPEGPVTLAATVADIRGNVSEPAAVTFTVDTLAPEITVDTPADNLVTNLAGHTLDGQVNEPTESLTLEHNGAVIVLAPQGDRTFSHALNLEEGANTLTVTAADRAGNTASLTRTVTLDTEPPPAPDIQNIEVGAPQNGLVTVTGAAGSVEPGSEVTLINTATGETATVTADGDGAFTATLGAGAGDTLEIGVADEAGNTGGSVQGEVPDGGEPPADTGGELTLLADPPLTFINKVRDVRFSVIVLKGVDDVVDEVRLVQTDANSEVLADIGEMTDDGQSGDLRANDGQYTFTLTVNEPTPITQHFRAIVNTQNNDRQVLSGMETFYITEKPYTTDPDEDKLISGLGYPFPVNRVVVRLVSGTTKATAQILANSVSGEIVGHAPIVNQYSFEVPATTIEELDEIMQQLRADSRVAGVMRSLMFDFDVVNDITKLREVDANKTQPFERILAFQAWDLVNANLESIRLSPVHVGIWDSGVDINHPEFADVEFGYLGIDYDAGSSPRAGCGRKMDSHGTGVAGIIGATSSLSAPGVEMNGILGGVTDNANNPAISYKLSSTKLVSAKNPEEFTKEINFLIEAGSQIVNYSAGMTLRSALSGSIARCVGANDSGFNEFVNTWKDLVERYNKVIFVSSAGNLDIDVVNHAPAGRIHADNFIAVASTNAADQKSNFSNHGEGIDIAAPGNQIYQPTVFTEPLDKGDYDSKSGTSFSAPFISGAAALIRSMDNTLTPKQIKQLIHDTGDLIETDPDIGGRRLNLEDLVHCGIDEQTTRHLAGVGAGSEGPEPGGAPAVDTKLRVPFGVEHSPDGSVYYVDRVNDGLEYGTRLNRIRPDGIVEVVAGGGTKGDFSGDGGPAIAARFNELTDVAVGRDGSIYLADQSNSRVRRVDPEGIIDTLAFGQGSPDDSRRITGVAVSDEGVVYFTQQDPDGGCTGSTPTARPPA